METGWSSIVFGLWSRGCASVVETGWSSAVYGVWIRSKEPCVERGCGADAGLSSRAVD